MGQQAGNVEKGLVCDTFILQHYKPFSAFSACLRNRAMGPLQDLFKPDIERQVFPSQRMIAVHSKRLLGLGDYCNVYGFAVSPVHLELLSYLCIKIFRRT
jgi:hypothetical protein